MVTLSDIGGKGEIGRAALGGSRPPGGHPPAHQGHQEEKDMISARQAITMGTSVAAVTAVLSALPTASAASIGRPADCHLRGQNYAEGAVFYPRENGTGWVCRN